MEKSAVQQVLKDMILAEDAETCGRIIAGFHDSPALLSVYADFLVEIGKPQLASNCYDLACRSFLESGRILQAALAKYSKWRIELPAKKDAEDFFDELARANRSDNPTNRFFKILSVPETVGFLKKVEKTHFPAGALIKKAGEVEEDLFFILSGEVRETFFHLVTQKSANRLSADRSLGENDCFGVIYPFDENRRSSSTVEAVSNVELARMPKQAAHKLSMAFPSMEKGFMRLCEVRSSRELFSAEDKTRMNRRYPVEVKMDLEILPCVDFDKGLSLSGTSKDCSISGVGFIAECAPKSDLEKIFASIKNNGGISARTVFHHGHIRIAVSGKVVRYKDVIDRGVKTALIGIQFESIPPNLQGVLFSAIKMFSTTQAESE